MNAATMRLIADPLSMELATDALEIPAKKGESSTSLMLSNGVFPARLHKTVARSIAQARGYQPAYQWQCARPILNGKHGAWLKQNPAIVADWRLRGEYQYNGIEAILNNMGGILNAAAGSGKTRMAAFSIDALSRLWGQISKRRMKMVWTAQTQEQVEQATVALEQLIGIRQRADLTIKCWQSYFAGGRQPMDFPELAEADVLVVDECHSSSDSIFMIANASVNAWWRIGLTATPVRTDDRELLMHAMFGGISYKIDQHRVRAEGHLMDANCTIYDVGTKGCLKEAVRQASQEELDKLKKWGENAADQEQQKQQIIYRHARTIGILENEVRNTMVAQLANSLLREGKTVLILVGSIKQGRMIQEQVEGRPYLVHSKMTVGEGRREEIMDQARHGKIPCMVATSLADQGLDIPCLDAVIMAGGGRGGKDGYLIEQRAARVQRTSKGKETPLVIDFMDLGYDKLAFQSHERVKKYRQMKFQITQIPYVPKVSFDPREIPNLMAV